MTSRLQLVTLFYKNSEVLEEKLDLGRQNKKKREKKPMENCTRRVASQTNFPGKED